MQQSLGFRVYLIAALLLGFATAAIAHGHDEDVNMDMGAPVRPTIPSTSSSVVAEPATYFQYGEHSGLMFAHIFLMTVGWVFVLPVGVMFSISHSRYTILVQFLFLTLNAIGVLLATVYRASTPDLYPNNAHHKIGWFLTCIMSAQVLIGVISAYIGRHEKNRAEREGFIPVSTEAMAEHQRLHNSSYRNSNDSGQGTERNTESLRSHSMSSHGEDDQPSHADDQDEKLGVLQDIRLDRFLSSRIPRMVSTPLLNTFRIFYNLVDRVILILAFAALSTGIVTYGGLFVGDRVFSGLAHIIKGGVFFWYGILTLGRWAGCFADVGWAWNVKPSRSKRPTAEFVESFLIFFYGSTNIFLEHLNAWGKEWSAQDLEHISITLMFFGGGLCGMLIESQRVRRLLNVTHQAQPSYQEEHEVEPPKSYHFSMNPLPALVVLLVGMMMSSHHQESMFSTMVHKQWGTLLVGAAFARAATYVIFYLAPPTSTLPGRPPTEIITAFCLMAGGLIFMVSARDSAMALDDRGLDAMFVFTVSMGLITFLMAWILTVIALKGWAVKKEKKSISAYRRGGIA